MSNLHLNSPSESRHLTAHQKVADSTPVWGSEIVFLGLEVDERYHPGYLQAPTFPTYITKKLIFNPDFETG